MAKKTTKKKVSASTSKKSVAKKVAPKAKAEPKAEATGEQKPSRYKGVESGLSVRDFQNQSILGNLKTKYTDEQLAGVWRDEFPNAAAFTAAHVRSVRAAINRGAHGNDAPDTKIPEFDETETALPLRGSKKAEREAAKAEVEPKAKAKGKILKLKKTKVA